MPGQLESKVNEDQIRLFVGPSADYYIKSWAKMDEKQTKNYGNLGVFLIGIFSIPAWLLYRKLYQVFGYYFAIVALLAFSEETGLLKTELPAGIVSYFNLLALLFFTFRGNFLYRRHVLKKLNSIFNTYKNDHVLKEIKRQGGTNLFLALLVSVILLGYIVTRSILK